MTQPVSAATPPAPVDRTTDAAPPAVAPANTSIQVERAAEAPVYVYRVTDNATGRILVQIPRRAADEAPSTAPGSRLNTVA